MVRWPQGTCAATLLLLASLSVASTARAQGTGRGFLFGEPRAVLTVRGGFVQPDEGSDIFAFSREQLTLEQGDFQGLLFGADLGLRLAPRVDLVLGVAFAGKSADSEMRQWVDEDDLPIRQSTHFRRIPVTATLRAYPLARGRSIGRFVWIPSRFAPYVGAGGGALWHRFHQSGEFVDSETLEIFYDEFTSSGWTGTAHGLAGMEVNLSPRFALVGEGRYDWAKADLGRDFEGFAPIDLSGLSVSLGVLVRF